jgi:hypothetical protein
MREVEFDNPADLSAWLAAAGIDTHTWGQGEAKRPADLWTEYQSGETSFQDDPPARVLAVAQIVIRRDGRILIEVEQEFEDGRRRARGLPPSEKLKRGEEPRAAARRCLREELGLEASAVALGDSSRVVEETALSPSYPGLPTRYRFHVLRPRPTACPIATSRPRTTPPTTLSAATIGAGGHRQCTHRPTTICEICAICGFS